MKRARTILMYSDSGGTKTSQCYHMAKWVYEVAGKKTRWISADGGGWAPIEDGGLIESGVVEAFDISKRKLAFADVRRLSQGFWPTIIKLQGKPRLFLTNRRECITTPEEWSKIGLVVVEGIFSIGKLLLGHMQSADETLGYTRPYTIEEDGVVIGGSDKGHYNIVQGELYKLIVQGFSTLPVNLVVYTSIVGKGEKKRTSDTIFGPQAAGSAVTDEVPTWVGDCLHLAREKIVRKGSDVVEERVVAWFRNHPDKQTGVDYLAKSRMTPELYPKLLEVFPNGFVPLSYDRGIRDYISTIMKLQTGAAKMNREWKEGVDSKRGGKQ